MNLQRIAARGLKGLALFPQQAVDFDFTRLEDGVYSLVGPNGAGKSTFLEIPLACFYGEFPSRPDNSLIASVDGRDAFLDVTIDVPARGRYRARVNVDAVSRATDAVLELTTPDGLTRPLNDGKISTFQAAVARELPSQALLLASAFAAQSKTGSFSELSKKDRRDLFAQLLGLERYDAYAQTAREAAAVLASRVAALLERLVPIQAETTPAHEDEISHTANVLQADLGAAEQAVAAATADLERLEAALEAARARALRFTTATAERDVLLGRRADRDRERRQVDEDLAQADARHRRRRADLESAAARQRAVHDGALAALESPTRIQQDLARRLETLATTLADRTQQRAQKIANNRGLLDRAAAIRSAAERSETERRRRDATERAIAEKRRTLAQLDEMLTAARRDVARAGDPQGAIARARTDAALIDQVPFGEHCAERRCQFVVQAVQARAGIPALEQQVAVLAELQHAVAGLEDQVATEQRGVAALEAARDASDRLLTDLRAEADLLVHLNAAEARVTELEAELRQLDADAAGERQRLRDETQAAILRVGAVRTDHLTAIAAVAPALAADLAAADADAHATRQQLEARAADVDRERAALDAQAAALATTIEETRAAHDALVVVETDVKAARAAATDAATRLVSVEHQVEAFDTRRARFTALVAERGRLEAAVDALRDQQAAWDVLTRVFGREGLPVLEIDAAGPGVSALANDLLQASFGGRFQVQLVTQEPKADGKGFKEVFEIRVVDAERGTDPDLGDLSGGERVVVDECLRSALAIYVNQRNVMPFQTFWRDETVGALDSENALRYVRMLRRLRERSGARKIYFIAHNMDCAALADGQIRIADGTIRVIYPPFATSEAA